MSTLCTLLSWEEELDTQKDNNDGYTEQEQKQDVEKDDDTMRMIINNGPSYW